MSKPSAEKQKKQRKRQQHLSAQNSKRLRRQNYPSFVFREGKPPRHQAQGVRG